MAGSLSELLDHARKLPNLTATQERELHARMHGGDHSARDKLVEHNMRLAIKMARDWRGCGLSYEDLVQESLLGLNVAVDRFDPDKGRLTTIATRWIYKMLFEAAYGKTDSIKRPSRLSRTVVLVQEHLSRHPHDTMEEISEAVGRPLQEVVESMDHARVVASTSEDDFREVAPEEVAEVASALGDLTPPEREAVAWRYGLYGKECQLEEVARKMTIDQSLEGAYTQQEAARLCRAAVRKLRAARQSDDDLICVVEK